MDDLPRSPRDDEHHETPEEVVVRLSVERGDLSSQLEPLPAAGPGRVKMQPALIPSLVDEELDLGDLLPQDLGIGWDAEEEAEEKYTPLGWIWLIGLILCVLGVWALTRLRQGEEFIEGQSEQVVARMGDEEEKYHNAEEFLAELERTLAAYLAAGTVEEKSKFVRHPGRVLPLMKLHYARHTYEPEILGKIVEMDSITLSKLPFVFVRAKLQNGEHRLLVAEQEQGGGLKFDWEAEVAYQPMPIEEYLAKRPLEAMDFRVFAKLDNFYAFEFSDSERYLALMLSVLDSEEWLFGYVERGTDLERELTDYLDRRYPDSRGKPVLLRVRFLPDSRGKRSVLIEKLMSSRWSYVENPES